ncbi:MAG: aromatic ring-hydroxylating oxygenase subunit alpha [Nannocystaceae bacterium]|nr:Rieske 2Fe-2S domain-containing protein [bacterium]
MDRDLDALAIDPDIERAQTLPGWVYDDPAWFARLVERVFPQTWHLYPLDAMPRAQGEQVPWSLLPGALDEPLLLTHDGAALRCVSNVCTHRGFVMVEQPSSAGGIRCRYHGRRFGLDGTLCSAPGFETSPDFPRDCDHLHAAQLHRWRELTFVNFSGGAAFEAWFRPVAQRLDAVVPQSMSFDPAGSPHYEMNANWALYCDNYLEGFHIPYVHPGLNAALDWSVYRTELFAGGSFQIASAKPDEPAFSLPKSHPDHGLRVAAYYAWLFPCTMINVYPWGMSVNIVLPQGTRRTKVVYRRYVWDASTLERGAGAGLDAVEYEDEAVVEACARGVRSRAYQAGRYAPEHERGVHHFHRILVAASRAPA